MRPMILTRRAAKGALALVVSAAIFSPNGSAAAEGEEAASSKKECLSQHEEAQVLRQAAKLKQAHVALLACSRDVCPSFVRADCGEWLSRLEKEIPSVVVTARVNRRDEFDVRIMVDNQVVATRLDGRPIELDPGVHSFRFEVGGWPAIEQQILLAEGERGRSVAVQFGDNAEREANPAAVPRHRPFPVVDYVLGGAALAGLGVFVAYGKWGLDRRDQLAGECSPFCSSSDVSSKVKSKFVIADIGLGVAAAAAAVGVVLYVTRPSVAVPTADRRATGAGATTTLSVGIDPTLGGARLLVRADL